jgi:hypothetical protein
MLDKGWSPIFSFFPAILQTNRLSSSPFSSHLGLWPMSGKRFQLLF